MADDGHRAPYVAFLGRLFDLERMGFCARSVFSRRPVLVPMIEESLATYACTALVRSLMGRATVGFLFRPRPALEGTSLRLRIKYYILRGLRRLPRVQTLTILPFSVEPRFAEIATGWIHDPQLWDLDDTQCDLKPWAQCEIVSEVRAAAAGRTICVALGRQDAAKGFDHFADIYTHHAGLRAAALFAFGGKVASGHEERRSAFGTAGGFAYDRFISDEELLALYATADLVWCAYAPGYDQASGILGRAVQLGIPVVVRQGSLIHRFCELERIAYIAVDNADDWRALVSAPPREPHAATLARKNRMRTESLDRLKLALGVAV